MKKSQKSQGDNIPRLLLDRYIEVYEDAATVESLTGALLDLGEAGQRIVAQMENRGLIHPVEREGSGAGGDVSCTPYDGEGEGGTSAQAAQAPTPRVPTGSPYPVREASECPGFTLQPDSVDGMPFQQSPLPTKGDTNDSLEEIIARVQRSKTEVAKQDTNPEFLQRCCTSLPVSGAGLTAHDDNHGGSRSLSFLSLEDNTIQLTDVNRADRAPEEEDKILNSQLGQRTARCDGPEGGEDEAARRDSAILRSSSLVTDAPSIPSAASCLGFRETNDCSSGESPAGRIRESQQLIENQLRGTTPSDTTAQELQPSSSSSKLRSPSLGDGDSEQARARQPAGSTNIFYITIKGSSAVQIGESNTANVQPAASSRAEGDLPAPIEEVQDDPQQAEANRDATGQELGPPEAEVNRNAAHQDQRAETERPLPAEDSEPPADSMTCSGFQSFHPEPWDDAAHQTDVKQPMTCSQEEEEEGRDPHDPERYPLHDVIDLRANNGDPIFGSDEATGFGRTSEEEGGEEEEEEEQQQEKQQQPPPNNRGILSRSFEAFVQFIDSLLD